ncbi:MAG: hypothetical protein GC164_09610 [Phycisphaera sp.]|nr:hypothetical protein [Phycisphaera sp.]
MLCPSVEQGLFAMVYALYTASVIGAIALWMMMPRRGYNPRKIGAILGAATLGGTWLVLSRELPGDLGISRVAFGYSYIFSAIAIIAAVRVITHNRPVYSALWFVLVVLSSAGLFLTLDAQFMALAMVIIYGGAILVTYVFVIMLAAQADDPEGKQVVTEYDAVAREPAGAIAAGFLLLAVLLGVYFQPGSLVANPDAAAPSDAQLIASTLTDRPAKKIEDRLGADATDRTQHLDNIERIGLDLFTSHPLGLELAGVILLVSLVGAVVIARQRVENEPIVPDTQP